MDESDKTEWEQMYQDALKIWDNLEDIEKDPNNLLESKQCPMHPHNFFNLSCVSGFNNLNGNTYEEYVEKCRKRV